MEAREDFAQRMHDGLADEKAQTARLTFVRTVTAALDYAGQVLNVFGSILRDDTAKGLCLVTRMGALLAGGAADLLDRGNAYAAAALARQLVEVEYLLWTFAEDAEAPSRWLTASRSQLGRDFKPRAMRERSAGKFRHAEYRSHCDTGGHPSPKGWYLVADTPPVDPIRARWVDLGQHLEGAWGSLAEAASTTGNGEAVAACVEPVERAREAWHERDPLAARLTALPDRRR